MLEYSYLKSEETAFNILWYEKLFNKILLANLNGNKMLKIFGLTKTFILNEFKSPLH